MAENHCSLYEDYKMKISTLGEVRISVVYYSRKKKGGIADLFYNYQNCTEKRKNFWNDLRESLVKSYKSSVVSRWLLWYNGKKCGKEGAFLP